MTRPMLSMVAGAFAFMQSASVFANTLTVTSLADEFPAATPGTFRYALANSSEGDTIVFDDSIKGGTINMLSVKDVTPQQDTSFVIAHALTIEGNGVTINGGWDGVVGSATGTRIFLTAAGQGKTTIKNLNLVNGRGAIWTATTEKFFIGGAINASSPICLENCQLVNNTTLDVQNFSVTVPDPKGGGAIFATADVELYSCYFGTNSIPAGTLGRGGAISLHGGSLTAEDTVFACNYTKTYGGGVAYFGANVTGVSFKKCKFLESSAANGVNAGNIDSAMTGGYMKFFDCVFRGVGCSSTGGNVSRSGAINCLKSVELTAVNCEFTGCLSSFGGAVYVNDGASSQPILFINCTFRGDHAATYGGAMEVFTPLYMVNCTVAGDYCSSSDGGGIYANSGIHLLNTVLAYNFCRPSNPRSCDIADYQNVNTNLRSLFKGTSTASFGTTYTLATSPDDTTATKLFAAYESVSSMSGPLLPADFSSRGTVTMPAFVSPKLSNDDNFSRVVEIGEDSVLNADGYLVRTNADCTYVEYSEDNGKTWKQFFKRDASADTANLTVITADQRGVPYKDGLPPIGAATVTPSCKHEHTTTNGYVAAQCEVAGDTGLVTCDDCGETLHDHEEIPPTGHLHTTTVGRVEPKCEEAGWTGTQTCDDCHKTLSEGEVIPALGHDWDDGEYTTPPTCTESGEATYTCKREDCGATKTGPVDPLGHQMGEWFIVKEPTPAEKGLRHRECQRAGCDYEENEEIDMHTIIVTTLADNFPAATPTEGSLRAALAAAAAGDVIMFDDSLAGGTIALPWSSTTAGQSSFIVTKAVSIVAPEGGITIDGGHTPGAASNDLSPRLFSVEKGIAGQVKFKGITFKRGFARALNVTGTGISAYPGGACYVGSPTRFEDCVFTECEIYPDSNFNANNGEMGGALCVHADLELKGCKFDHCRTLVSGGAAKGGALSAYGAVAASAPKLMVEDCEFIDCSSHSYGGAIYLSKHIDVMFKGCLFDGNVSAVGRGGAICGGDDSDGSCSVICDGCSFRGNFAVGGSGDHFGGGAVSAKYGKWVFNRCEFSGNASQFCGGALSMRSGAVEVRCINCTFFGNMAMNHGGACDFRNGNYYLVNCTFAANRIWHESDKTDSMSIYVGTSNIKLLNCVSVYCPNNAGWVGGSDATQRSTGNYTGFASAGGLNPTCINCLRGDYTPITDLGDSGNVAAASKLFANGYDYWVVPSPRYPGDENPVTLANTKVVYPKLANDAKNPNAPRVLPILENGDLGIYNGGYPVEVNDDFTWVRYSTNGGTSWTDLYKDTGADESTLALITSDQRGLRYKDGMIPIGAAGIAGEVVHSGFLIIVK